VRYFRDSQPDDSRRSEARRVAHSVWHKLAEEAPGASPDKDQALARAEEFLA